MKMKKVLPFTILFIAALTLSACGGASITETAETEKKQFIEIMDNNETIICQITDNETIMEITENENMEQWEIVSAIPADAEKQYTYISYELITEPVYKSAEGNKISVGTDCLYSDGENYYIVMQTNDNNAVISYKIPDLTGKYLEEIAGGTSLIQKKEELFLSWGIEENDIAESLTLNNDGKGETEGEEYRDYEKYPYQDVGEFDYAGVKKASKYQKIEIYAEDKTVYSTSDLEEIANILNAADMQNWERVSEIPENIWPVCTLKKYAHPKKQSGTELEETEYWEIYQSADHYYLTEHIIAVPGMEETEETYIITDPAGDWFEKRTGE